MVSFITIVHVVLEWSEAIMTFYSSELRFYQTWHIICLFFFFLQKKSSFILCNNHCTTVMKAITTTTTTAAITQWHREVDAEERASPGDTITRAGGGMTSKSKIWRWKRKKSKIWHQIHYALISKVGILKTKINSIDKQPWDEAKS